MRVYRYSYRPSYNSFGPGGITPAIKAIIWTNISAFVITIFAPSLVTYLGLTPAAVVGRFWIWQPITYIFLHGGLGHILFNMLALWMFGVQLERRWGTRFFVRFYFVTGIGAGITTLIASFFPFLFGESMYYAVTIGASGAIYGILLAFALHYPDVPIYMWLLFPIPAKYFVMIIGGISFLMSISSTGSSIAHITHLGGLLFGYLYLIRGSGQGLTSLRSELQYRYLKWRMNRLRRKFDVYSGGRPDDRDQRTH